MVKWEIKLNKLDINYYPQPLMKDEIMMDFLVECTILEKKSTPKQPEEENAKLNWIHLLLVTSRQFWINLANFASTPPSFLSFKTTCEGSGSTTVISKNDTG